MLVRKSLTVLKILRCLTSISYGEKVASDEHAEKINIIEKKISSGPNFGTKKLTKNLVSSYKKSDILYVFGSGSSLNDLNESQWQNIKNGDTLFLNYNIILEFSPTFFMFELPRDYDRKNIFSGWTHKRGEQYKNDNTCVIFRHFHSAENKSLSQLGRVFLSCSYAPYEYKIHGYTERSFNNYLKKFKEKVSASNEILSLPVFKASLFTAVYFGYMSGYKDIRLVGVDLNDTKYFYESAAYSKLSVPRTGQQVRSVHKTDEHLLLKSISISKCIDILYRNFMQPEGVELSVSNKNSSLAKFIPVKEVGALVPIQK